MYIVHFEQVHLLYCIPQSSILLLCLLKNVLMGFIMLSSSIYITYFDTFHPPQQLSFLTPLPVDLSPDIYSSSIIIIITIVIDSMYELGLSQHDTLQFHLFSWNMT
jgi:hypothetical protein